MNEIAVRLRDYDNCHDGDIDAAANEIDRLEKVIDDQRKELDARETILNQIQEACGSGWWSGAIDFRKEMQEFISDDCHKIDRETWDNMDLYGITLYTRGKFFVAYYDDSLVILENEDDDHPMMHSKSKTIGEASRSVIHKMHIADWLNLLAERCYQVQILGENALEHDQ